MHTPEQENPHGYYLFLKAGAQKTDIEAVPLKSRVASSKEWGDCLRAKYTLAHLYFGPQGQYEIVFDDNGRLVDDPISTLEINRHLICGPCAIWKANRDEEEEIESIGFTKDEINQLVPKLKLLEGRPIPPLDDMVVTTFGSFEDLRKAMNEKNRFAAKESENNWGEK